MAHLAVQNLTKTFALGGRRLQAVFDASFEIERGEFVAITGHSGSGKTTLLSMLGGLSRPSSGTILLGGTEVHALDGDALSEYRCERIGFVFQFASLLPVLTAKENLLLPLRFRPRVPSPEDADAKASELLAQVGLGDRSDAYPAQLSGGQQRRVAIARAFMNDPDLVLADEPTGDLDEETEADVMKVFRTINETRRTTFLMVTHDAGLARQAGRQLVMHAGHLRELQPGGRRSAG